LTEDRPGPLDLSDSNLDNSEMTSEDDDEECETCGGEGSILVADRCTVRISECCGGCTAPCPECHPKFEREYEKDE